jgi:hypothetical protein
MPSFMMICMNYRLGSHGSHGDPRLLESPAPPTRALKSCDILLKRLLVPRNLPSVVAADSDSCTSPCGLPVWKVTRTLPARATCAEQNQGGDAGE